MFSDNDIRNDYFDWLYEKMTEGRVHEHVSYLKLFEYLHKTEFIFSIPNDVNRAKDGTGCPMCRKKETICCKSK